MIILKLTEKGSKGDSILINLDHVICIEKFMNHTEIATIKEHYQVTETVDEIYEIIKKLKK